jgi:hypothetical protein
MPNHQQQTKKTGKWTIQPCSAGLDNGDSLFTDDEKLKG